MKKSILALLCLALSCFAAAQQTINAMFYNLYRFPDNPPANRQNILKDIFTEYKPDLFMVCELVRESGADNILNTALQTPTFNYARAAFTPTTVDLDDPLQQMVFYNRAKLVMMNQRTLLTAVREINQYTFIINDPALDSVFLEVFVTHLKSSEGAANQQARLHMIDTFVRALETVPVGHHVLLAGDFNFYNGYTEPAYKKILAPTNPIRMVDPVDRPGNWSDNDSFKDIHTQATRTSAAGFGIGGATGGLDDRFDFIMMSQSLKDAAELHYLPGSYKAFGNNGNCFNQRIDHYDCDGPYSQTLRKNLHNMSDHLPVVMQLQTNRQFLAIAVPTLRQMITFPEGNVAHDYLRLKIDAAALQQPLRFVMYNALGQKLRGVEAPAGAASLTLPTANLACGLYYLAICGNGRVVLKFVKQ